MLLWHPRVLHSAMPNTSVGNRTAALLLFVEREYYDEIRVIDNIFK
jgi:ectoine hydroxylase-related dioxygenase (phytanoyl-CoA dioxygenase family)